MSTSEQEALARLVGKTIRSVRFMEDAGGYQHLLIVTDDFTTIEAKEIGQAGETRLLVDGNIVPVEDTRAA